MPWLRRSNLWLPTMGGYINEISPQSILASSVGFTLNGLVLVQILDSHHKPLASWLPFISIVLPLALPWLPIVKSQRLKTGSQH